MFKQIFQNKIFRKLRFFVLLVVLASVVFGSTMRVAPKQAQAVCVVTIPCLACWIGDREIAIDILARLVFKPIFQGLIRRNIRNHIDKHEEWIVEDFFERFWVKGLAELTEFLGAFGMYQVEMAGALLDAKQQVKTTRLYFKLQAEAHKDYHPSDDFCWFGTNSRGLASSEGRADLNRLALSQKSIQRQLGYSGSSSADTRVGDKKSRWDHFVEAYCDPKDNGWDAPGTGLDLACDHDGVGGLSTTGAVDRSRVNLDIDYTRLIEEPRTLEVNFSDPTISDNEEDVLAMAANLYADTVLSRELTRTKMESLTNARSLFLDLRSVVAKRNVAESVFNSIVAMKSAGTGSTDPADLPDTGSYMAALVRELMPTGATDDEVIAILGANPSYYAQLEFLGKKIYQNPDFFANLYDKPANVKRKSVAMKGVELMLDRALFESELRQEMVLSILLSSKLNKDFRNVNSDLGQEK